MTKKEQIKTHTENFEFLRDWLKKAEGRAKEIKRIAKLEGKRGVFTIGSTSKVSSGGRPYLTPLRHTSQAIISGSVVFSQAQAILLARQIDGIVDQILVDAEKKISISLGYDEELQKYFDLPDGRGNVRSKTHIELGNISSACFPFVKKSEFHEFKANDATVDAAWQFLSDWFSILSGRKMAIIGSGNIGFKLALKLVECGVSVDIVRRDTAKGMLMANAINIVKPAATFASAKYVADPLQAAAFSDALIGCTGGIPLINWPMVQASNKDAIVMDVGKGSIDNEVIERCAVDNIPVIRCDVSAAIDGLVVHLNRSREIRLGEMGRKELSSGVVLVSGGFMGAQGDIVVDNFRQPKSVIGVADGSGDFKMSLAASDLEHLRILKEKTQIDISHLL